MSSVSIEKKRNILEAYLDSCGKLTGYSLSRFANNVLHCRASEVSKMVESVRGYIPGADVVAWKPHAPLTEFQKLTFQVFHDMFPDMCVVTDGIHRDVYMYSIVLGKTINLTGVLNTSTRLNRKFARRVDNMGKNAGLFVEWVPFEKGPHYVRFKGEGEGEEVCRVSSIRTIDV